MNNSRTNKLTTAGLLVAFALLQGCDKTVPVEQDVEPVSRPAMIETVAASAITKMTFNGVVRSTQRVELSFRQGGKLATMLVQEGDLVTKGQPLARLEKQELQTISNSARVEAEKAKIDYERGRKIFNASQAISRSDLELLKTKYDLAANRLVQTKEDLDNTTLISPFDGMISKKLVNNFNTVQANQIIYEMHNPNDLEAVINVPSQQFLKRSAGLKALAEIEGIQDLKLPLIYKYYSSDADPLSQTYQVILGFEDLQDKKVLPGMSVIVHPVVNEAATQDNDYVLVKIDAVIPTNTGEQFVWLVNQQQTVEKRLVEVGSVYDDRIEITSGLTAGDKIVTAGVHSLSEGTPVHALEKKDGQ